MHIFTQDIHETDLIVLHEQFLHLTEEIITHNNDPLHILALHHSFVKNTITSTIMQSLEHIR